MSSSNPPYPYYDGIPFNPSFFTSDNGTGLSESTANTLYLRKTVADTATAQETFSLGIKAQKVDGLLSSSIMYVGNNITSGSLILGNTGIRTKNQGIFETLSIRTPTTSGGLSICTDLTAGSVDIGSVNGTVNLSASSSGGVNVPTSLGASANAVNVAYLTTALTNVATVNQVQTFTQTNTFNNATAGIKADIIAGVATTGTQSLYATKTAGTLNIATSQTSGNINIGASGVTTTANGTLIANTINATGTNTPNIANITANVDAGVNKGCSLQVGKNGTNPVTYRLLLGSDNNHSIYSTDGNNKTFFVEYGMSGDTWNFYNASSSGVVATIGNTGGYTQLSNGNKKKDFEPSMLGLNEILQLKPTLFRYKNKREDKEEEDKQEPKSIGFIAQEVQPIIPHAYVSGDDFIGLDYNSFIPVLVKAVQEMKLDYEAKIQELKEDYDAKLSKLEERLLALETKHDSI